MISIKYLNPIKYLRRLKYEFIKVILKTGIPLLIKIKFEGKEVRFVVTSFLEYALRAKQSYIREKVTMHWIKNEIGQNDIVYDVGANVGAYSLLIGKKLDKGKVYSFEPESSNYFSLNRNIIENGLSDKVLAYSVAFGNTNRPSKFYLSSIVPGSAMHSVDKPISDGVEFSSKHVQGVYVVSPDDFSIDPAVEFPNHIKIDVDGLEKEIVKSMSGLLCNAQLKTIMIEVAEVVSEGEIESIITRSGFSEKMREQSGASKNVYNILYVRR